MDHVTNIFKKFIQVGSSPRESLPTPTPANSAQYPRRSLLKEFDPFAPESPQTCTRKISLDKLGLDERELKYDADAAEVVDNFIDISKYEEVNQADREIYNDISLSENQESFEETRAKSSESPEIFKSAESLDISSQQLDIRNADKTDLANCSDIKFSNLSGTLRSPDIKVKCSLSPVPSPECLFLNHLGFGQVNQVEIKEEKTDEVYSSRDDTFHGQPVEDISSLSEHQVKQEAVEDQFEEHLKDIVVTQSIVLGSTEQETVHSVVGLVNQLEAVHDTFHEVQGHPVEDISSLSEHQVKQEAVEDQFEEHLKGIVDTQSIVLGPTEQETAQAVVGLVNQLEAVCDTFHEVHGHPVENISSLSEQQVNQEAVEDQFVEHLKDFVVTQSIVLGSTEQETAQSVVGLVNQVEAVCDTFHEVHGQPVEDISSLSEHQVKQEAVQDQFEEHLKDFVVTQSIVLGPTEQETAQSVVGLVNQVEAVHDIEQLGQINCIEIKKEKAEEVYPATDDTFHDIQGHPVEDISSLSEQQVKQEAVENQIEEHLKDIVVTQSIVLGPTEQETAQSVVGLVNQGEAVPDIEQLGQINCIEIKKEQAEEVYPATDDTFHEIQGHPVEDISSLSEQQVNQEAVEDRFVEHLKDFVVTQSIVLGPTEQETAQSVVGLVNQVEAVHDIEQLGQINCIEIKKEKAEEVYPATDDTFHDIQGHPVEDISSLSEQQVNQEAVEDRFVEHLKDFVVTQSIVLGSTEQETAQSVVRHINQVEAVPDIEQLGQINSIEIKKEKAEEVYPATDDTFHKIQGHPVGDISSLSEHQVKQEAVEDQIEEHLKGSIVKQSIVLGPTEQEIAQSKMGDINDTLNALQQENSDLKLKLNASQQEKASLELKIRQKEEVIIKSQAEALKSEQLFKQELKQLKEQLKENSKFIENDSTKELQEQLKEAKSREAKLLNELAEKQNLEKVAEKYQSVLKSRLNENVKLKEDLDSAKTHLANLELAFSDLHSKYEKAKESLEGYKKYTAELLINLDTSHQNSKQQEERYESLKTFAKNQIDRERFANENAKLQAIIKRLEIKCGSLEVTLSQKTEECLALSALCDEENFTLFDLHTKNGYCFLWHEGEGELKSHCFASIICSFLATKVLPNMNPNDKLNIILYSDGCGAQNRNSTLSNALLNFSVENNVCIIQKYLEKGHTQMECDSMHSTIERKISGRVINVPADYVNLLKTARINPRPYEVQYLDHTYFKNFSEINFVNSIRPGRKAGDPTVQNIRALKYNSDGSIEYKIRHSDEFQTLPVRFKKCSAIPMESLPNLYHGKLKIKREKFEHLQALKILNMIKGLDERELKYDADATEVADNLIDISKYEEVNQTDPNVYNDILVRFSNGDVSSELNHKNLSDSQILEQREFAEQEHSREFNDRSIYSKSSQGNGEIDSCSDELKTINELDRGHSNSQNISGELKEVDSLAENQECTEETDAKSSESSEIFKSAECLDVSSQQLEIENADKTELADHVHIKISDLSETLRSPDIKFKCPLEPVPSSECLNTSLNQLGIFSPAKTEQINNSDIQFNNLAETGVGSPESLDISVKQLGIDGSEPPNNSDAKVNCTIENVALDILCSPKLENNEKIDLSSTVVVEQVERNYRASEQDQFIDQVDPLKDQQSVFGQVTQVEAVCDIEQLEPSNCIKIKEEKVEEIYPATDDTFHKVQGHLIEDISSLCEHQVKQEAVEDQFEEHLEDSIVKQSKVLGPTVQKIAQFKMGDINDTLNALQQENSDLKLKLNASQQEKASLELEIRQKEEVIIKSQAEALESEQLFKQELKQLKEQLKENSKFMENDLTKELQEQLKEAKSREAKLLNELAEKQNLEKYEKAKESLEGYKKYTAELLINLDTSHQNSKQQEERYESLKTFAKNQIDRERFANENAKLQAIIKRLEIKCGSLEVTLSQKTEECLALSALCDEVTGKKV
nr:unnamed protein product [Callosobruchus chinensis]